MCSCYFGSRKEAVYYQKTPTYYVQYGNCASSFISNSTSCYCACYVRYSLLASTLQFAEMALAHELDLSDNQPTPAYHVARSRYFMTRREFEKAVSSVDVAIKEETEVCISCATHLVTSLVSIAEFSYY